MHNLKNEVRSLEIIISVWLRVGGILCVGWVGGGSHIARGWIKLHVTAPTTRVTQIKLILNHFQQ